MTSSQAPIRQVSRFRIILGWIFAGVACLALLSKSLYVPWALSRSGIHFHYGIDAHIEWNWVLTGLVTITAAAALFSSRWRLGRWNRATLVLCATLFLQTVLLDLGFHRAGHLQKPPTDPPSIGQVIR